MRHSNSTNSFVTALLLNFSKGEGGQHFVQTLGVDPLLGLRGVSAQPITQKKLGQNQPVDQPNPNTNGYTDILLYDESDYHRISNLQDIPFTQQLLKS